MHRVVELDGLRGLAILLVVAYHAGGYGPSAGGTVGVTLFFVLSGYLITRLLLRELGDRGRLDLKAFWSRRARRLGPAYVPVAAYTVVLFAASGSAVGVAIASAVPIADYLRAVGVPLLPLGHTWSLAVEEQFYLVWPVVLAWLVTRRRAMAWVVVAAAASAGWRVAAVVLGWEQWAYHALDTNAFGLLAGAALALSGRSLPWPWGAAGVAGLLCLSWLPMSATWVIASAPLAAGLGVVAVAGVRGVPGLSWSPLCWVGTISYGWYLWHLALSGLVPDGHVGLKWLVSGVALLVAAASWRVIERPVLQRRRLTRPDLAPETSPQAA